MNFPKQFEAGDRELVKLAFLWNAQEGNDGLYSLVWELGRYADLSIGRKYTLASELLNELVHDGLLLVEEFEDAELKNRVRYITAQDLDGVLNNPCSWYPGQAPFFAIEITESGSSRIINRDKRAE